MKKFISILLSVLLIIGSVAISISADNSEITFIPYDNMSGNLNAGTGTAKTETDNMTITVNGGLLTKYANYIITALNLPDKSDIFGFQIDYHVEVKPNESFTVFTKSEENKYTVMGKRKDGTLIFTAEIKYSNS